MSNYPPGTFENDPSAPWNEPETPIWMQEYLDYTPTLNQDVRTPHDCIISIDSLIEELEYMKEGIEEIDDETIA